MSKISTVDLGVLIAHDPRMPRYQPTLAPAALSSTFHKRSGAMSPRVTFMPWVVDMRVEIAPRFPCVVLNEPIRTDYRSRMLRAHFAYAHRQKPPTDDDIDRLCASGAPEEEVASAETSRAAEMTAAFRSKGHLDKGETDALLQALDVALGCES